MTKSIVFALLLTAAVAPFAHASIGDCDSKGTPALGTVDTGAGFYVDDRNLPLGNGLWIYQESNQIPGLQRGGSSQIVPDDNEVCVDDPDIAPDTLIV